MSALWNRTVTGFRMAITHAPTLVTTELLSLADMADTLGASVHSVRKWVRRGFPDAPAEMIQLPDGQYRVCRSDLDRWIDFRCTPRVA